MLNEYQQSALYLQAERSPFPGIANPQPHQLYRNPQLDIRSRQLGPIFPGHIRVQMIYAGICGTDIHLVNPDLLTGYVQSSAPAYLPDEGRLTKNGKSPGSAGGLEKFDISGSPSGNFKP